MTEMTTKQLVRLIRSSINLDSMVTACLYGSKVGGRAPVYAVATIVLHRGDGERASGTDTMRMWVLFLPWV